MATLPASSDATTSTATEGQVKTWLAAVRTYIAQQLGAAGTQAESLTTLGAPFNSAITKTGAYTVVAADRGKVIRCTGTWTLSVTAVASLGDGFVFGVLNEGGGTITVDPNLAEQVDGATTKAVGAGKLSMFYVDGTKMTSIGSVDLSGFAGINRNFSWELVYSVGLAIETLGSVNAYANWGAGVYLAYHSAQTSGGSSLASRAVSSFCPIVEVYNSAEKSATMYVYKLKKEA